AHIGSGLGFEPTPMSPTEPPLLSQIYEWAAPTTPSQKSHATLFLSSPHNMHGPLWMDFMEGEARCHDPPPGHHPDTPHLLAPTTLFRLHYSAAHCTPALSAPRFPEAPTLTPAISTSTLIDPTQPRSPALTLPDPTAPPLALPGNHSGDHFRCPGRHPMTDH
ncbi:hypothetical protein C0992_007573, partial [Termitomyces sp. T32_za158]